MAQVSVTINGRKYPIACDDGQEAHLSRLAAYVDRRIGELVAAVGQVGDAHLLVMASLLVADELSDAYTEIESPGTADDDSSTRRQTEENLANRMDSLANRIEGIAERLERP